MELESKSSDKLAALAAYWICQKKYGGEYYKQSELPALLGDPTLPSSHISRILKKARENGFYQVRHILNLPEEFQNLVEGQVIRASDLEAELRLLSPRLKKLVVCSASKNDPGSNPLHYESSLATFGENLGSSLLDILLGSKYVGVSMGRTIAAAVQGMQFALKAENRGKEYSWKECFPIWGNICRKVSSGNDSSLLQHSSSAMAIALQAAFGNEAQEVPSLEGLNFIFPEEWTSLRRVAYLENVAEFTAYYAVFGANSEKHGSDVGTSAAIEQMDTCLITLNALHDSFEYVNADFLQEFFSKKFLSLHNRFCSGDIGGRLILARAQSKDSSFDEKSNEHLRRVTNAFTSLAHERILALAKEAGKRSSKKVGVVAVVHGASKAEVLLQALEQDGGCINVLCIDHHLALALKRSLESESQ